MEYDGLNKQVETARKREGTILFCDIRNFTSLVDEKDPLEAVFFANSVLAKLGNHVEENSGVIDRFTGDGFMAHFGFTSELKQHQQRAVNAALDMREALKQINSERYLKVESVLNFGIGINSGSAAYTTLSTRRFKQTTLLGDTVNLASRIEEMTKYFLVDILISDSTYKAVQQHYSFRKMPLKSVQGKKKPVQTYWLTPMNTN